MRTTIPKPTDRDEWLAARAPYIGASEAAALVGEHRFLSAGELAVMKLGGSPKDETSAMRRGRFLESAIADWWEDEFGLALLEPDVLYVYDNTFVSTLDRLVIGAPVAVEIKTTNRFITEPERSWYWQCQIQCLCGDLDHVELVVFDQNQELKTFVIEPDAEDQALVLEAATKFLASIRRGELPPDIDLDYRAASALHPTVAAEAVDLDDAVARWCRVLGSLQSRIKDLESDADQVKGMIAHQLGDAAEGRHQGRTIVTWRSTTRTSIDAKRLRAMLPEIAAEYATSTTYRTLRLKERK